MKQVLARKGKIFVEEVPAPTVHPGCVLVQVKYSLVSTGTELSGIEMSGESLINKARRQPDKARKMIQRMRDEGVLGVLTSVRSVLNMPKPLGYSCAGIVLEVGSGVKGFAAGDRVACGGDAYHAEVLCVTKHLCVKVPPDCSLSDAASATVGAIAMQGVRRACVQLGETVVVVGVGLIGQITCQLLKNAGCHVIAVDPNEWRLHLAKRLGADFGFSPGSADISRKVGLLTKGQGADSVIITAASGSSDVVNSAMEMVRKKGKVVVVGAVGMNLRRKPFYDKEADFLISCSYGPGRYDDQYESVGIDYPYAYVRWTENRNMEEYVRMLSDKRVQFGPMVTEVVPVAEAARAYESLSRSNDRMAVLFKYSEDDASFQRGWKTTKHLASSRRRGPLRVAIVGAGSFARATHLPNISRLSRDFHLRAVVNREGYKADSLAREFGADYGSSSFDDVIDDREVDIVIIATRHNLHAQMAVKAAKAGKGVLLEKPIALTLDELRDVEKVVRASGVPFMVGYNRRFSPLSLQMKRVLSDSAGPKMIGYRVNAGYIPPTHWTLSEEGGGRIVGEACHMFDLLLYLVGSPISRVDSKAVKLSDTLYDENVVTSLEFRDGSIATLFYSTLGSSKMEKERVEAYVDGRVMLLEDFKTLTVFGDKVSKEGSGKVQKGYLEELKEFAAYMKNGGAPPIPFDELFESARTSLIVRDQLASSREKLTEG
ncbi:MAG TPA: bi-domain-containing oxidoreductase [Candidatus Acidoferrales bacterium]|nr:bi-domain-containing oxidoreductase [Candidatus Acidoferrales bacterium]